MFICSKLQILLLCINATIHQLMKKRGNKQVIAFDDNLIYIEDQKTGNSSSPCIRSTSIAFLLRVAWLIEALSAKLWMNSL